MAEPSGNEFPPGSGEGSAVSGGGSVGSGGLVGGSSVAVGGGSGVSVSGGLSVWVGRGVCLGVFVGSGVSVATSTVDVGGSSVAVGRPGVLLAAEDGLITGVEVRNGVDVNILPPPPPPPSYASVWVRKTGRSVRVGVAESVAVFVLLAVGVNVSVGPVIGRRKARKGWVGSGGLVGVKNIKANALCVNTISGGVGVGVNRGRRISSITSGDSP